MLKKRVAEHFKDKVALVTGGASGIGRALARELAACGALVVVADINADGARTVAEEISSRGGRARGGRLDVTDAPAVRRAVEETFAEDGRLDLLFNNAGFAVAGEVRDIPIDDWRRIIDVNLLGVVHGIAAAYPLMVKQGFGHIINIASVAGLVAAPVMVPYTTTKHAVVGLSTSLRAEAAGLGVKVGVVCPGFVRTNIFDAATIVNNRHENLVENIFFNMIEPEDAAREILRGTARDRAVIVFPAYARLLWRFVRFCPGLIEPVMRKVVRDFRKTRGDQGDPAMP